MIKQEQVRREIKNELNETISDSELECVTNEETKERKCFFRTKRS